MPGLLAWLSDFVRLMADAWPLDLTPAAHTRQ